MREKIRRILEDEVLTATEAGDLLGWKRSTIRRQAERGLLPGVKKGPNWFFDRQDIEQTAAKR